MTEQKHLIFDTHAHYDDHAFDEDRKELLSGLLEHGVGTVVNAAASVRSMPRILRMTQQYPFLYAAAGIHPCEAYASGDNTGSPVMYLTDPDGEALRFHCPDDEETDRALAGVNDVLAMYDAGEVIEPGWKARDREMRLIRAILGQRKVVAVGEIGLDYHYEDTLPDVQKEWFAAQIALAREFRKPIIIHSRDAAALTLDMVRGEQAGDVGGIVHCFSYSREMAERYLDLGFLIGIGGVITYKNARKLKEVADFLPMDRMVLETDCPYLAPVPYRGKRNDSSLIAYVAQVVAERKGLAPEQVIDITRENANRLFGIGCGGED